MAGKAQGSFLGKKKIEPKSKTPPKRIPTSQSFGDLLPPGFSPFCFLSLLCFLPIFPSLRLIVMFSF